MLYYSVICLTTAFLLLFIINTLLDKWLALLSQPAFLLASVITYIVILVSGWLIKGTGDMSILAYLTKFHRHTLFFCAALPYFTSIALILLFIHFKPGSTKTRS